MDAMPPCGLQALGHQGRHDSHRHSLCECLWCEHHFPHLEEGQSKVHFNSEHQSPRPHPVCAHPSCAAAKSSSLRVEQK